MTDSLLTEQTERLQVEENLQQTTATLADVQAQLEHAQVGECIVPQIIKLLPMR